MRINTERTGGVSASTMAALMLAVFTVSVDFGVGLPRLGFPIEKENEHGHEDAKA